MNTEQQVKCTYCNGIFLVRLQKDKLTYELIDDTKVRELMDDFHKAEAKNEEPQTVTKTPTLKQERMILPFILALLGGISYISFAAYLMFNGPWLERDSLFKYLWWSPIPIVESGKIGLLLSIPVVIGALLIFTPGKERVGSALVIVFSFISFPFIRGGFYFSGILLGLAGAVLALQSS
jgi:hypothetical protein